MKQITLILATVFFSAISFAQKPDNHHEKIKTLKVAYITEKLNLTQTEAQNFWPIYNKFEDDYSALRDDVSDKRKDIDVDKISEKDAKALIKEMEQLYEKRYRLYQKYMTNLQTVLPAKKVISLKKVEDDFKRKMFEEYKNRHGNSKKSS
ncbi:Spy/CpxP family protein refolding chaperone [Bizionia myxarmorum]|uniref:Sensor of ECF-type sigma factor n=1 Tax=Bizionia myxarmorum TaxID=291186 RepID=A0A5D0R8G2_9FLAO|nr:sensor of ECF-type sigma factor [Bizionia myxarmorum]TYB77171.1 sensor of ECF-type sigma factor [Bizionia myxarmorum]